jgi:TRAP-type C4-dicarboxylate transport system permease small subunit
VNDTRLNTLPPETRPPLLDRLTTAVAVAGGLLALAMAALVLTSVLGRWLFNKPVEGDFEFVKMATAIGVFTYLPYTQLRRGNIMVDTFTTWLGLRLCRLLDAFWDLVFAIFMGLCAVGLFVGAREAMRSGETTMQLQLIVWPAIGLAAVLCLLLALTALMTATRLIGNKT